MRGVIIRRGLGLLATVAMLGSACGTGTPDNVRIGVIAPLTGPQAFLGQELLAGAELAVDELNRNGGLLGRPVELVVVDDADLTSLPAQLADLAEVARVTAVIGPESPGVLLGARSPLTRRQVPAILPTAFAGDLTTARSTVVRTVPSARAQAAALAEWLTGERGIDQVALLLADPAEATLAADDLRSGLAVHGVEVAASVGADGRAADLRAAVAALRDRAPDAPAVLLWGPPAVVANATVAIRQLDWDVQILLPASSFVGEYRTLAAGASEGVVFAAPLRTEWFEGELPGWLLRYQVREGIGLLPQLDTLVLDFPVLAIAASEAVRIIASAVERTGSRVPDVVGEAIVVGTHTGMLMPYDLADREAWAPDDLSIARLHHLAVTFDIDPDYDAAAQRRFWEAQVTLDILPDDLADGPLGALVDALRGARDDAPLPDYETPLPGPGPVARP